MEFLRFSFKTRYSSQHPKYHQNVYISSVHKLSLIGLFEIYFLRIYSVADIILTTGVIAMNKADKISILRACMFKQMISDKIRAVRKIIQGSTRD